MITHFGIKLSEGKYGLKLTRENYAIVKNKSSFNRIMESCDYIDQGNMIYSEEWCNKHLKDCLENYDLNMEYFSLLNHNEFDIEINKFLEHNSEFIEINDLNLYEGKSGYYVMIFDEYCQVYVGTTQNIRLRIKQHWNKVKQFDRILFPIGSVNTSILSVDSFRALDNTRIFVYITEEIYEKEDEFINCFSTKFSCNRMNGGKIGNLIEAIKKMKRRQLK